MVMAKCVTHLYDATFLFAWAMAADNFSMVISGSTLNTPYVTVLPLTLCSNTATFLTPGISMNIPSSSSGYTFLPESKTITCFFRPAKCNSPFLSMVTISPVLKNPRSSNTSLFTTGLFIYPPNTWCPRTHKTPTPSSFLSRISHSLFVVGPPKANGKRFFVGLEIQIGPTVSVNPYPWINVNPNRS